MRRKLITILGVVLLSTTASTSVVLAAPVPFEQKRTDPRAGASDLDASRANDAVKAIEAQRDAGRGAGDAFDDLWATNITEDSIYYRAIIDSLVPLTGLGFFFWVGLTLIQWKRGEAPPWKQVGHPLLTFVLLFNGGQYLAVANQTGRAIIQSTTQSIFNFQIKGIEGRVHLQRINTFQAYLKILDKLELQCKSGREQDFDTCMERANKTAKDYLEHKRGNSDDTVWDVVATDVQSVVLNNGFIQAMATLSGGYFLILEWGVAGLAMLAPFLTSMHLFPKGRVGLAMLLGGYIALLTASVTYTTLSVGAAAYIASAAAGQPLIYGTITSVVNPFLALMLGYFGFNAVLMAPARAVSSVSRVFRRF